MYREAQTFSMMMTKTGNNKELQKGKRKEKKKANN